MASVRYDSTYNAEQGYTVPNPMLTTGNQGFEVPTYTYNYGSVAPGTTYTAPTATYTAPTATYTAPTGSYTNYGTISGVPAVSSEVRNAGSTYSYGLTGAGNAATSVRNTVVGEPTLAAPPKITFGHPQGGFAQTTFYQNAQPVPVNTTTTVVSPQPNVQTITTNVVGEAKQPISTQVGSKVAGPASVASTSYSSKHGDEFLCSKWCWILTAIIAMTLLTLALLYGLGVIGGPVGKGEPNNVSAGKVGTGNLNVNGPHVNTPSVNVNGPHVNTPSVNVNGPHVNTPSVNVNGPHVNTPSVNVNGPHVNTPSLNVTGPKLNTPSVDINGPKLNTPSLNVTGPQVNTPSLNVNGPKLNTPSLNVNGPQVNTPTVDINGPKVSTPSLNVNGPKVSTPSVDVTAPHVSTPSVNVNGPSVSTPSVNVNGPSVSTPSVNVPRGTTSVSPVPAGVAAVSYNAPTVEAVKPTFTPTVRPASVAPIPASVAPIPVDTTTPSYYNNYGSVPNAVYKPTVTVTPVEVTPTPNYFYRPTVTATPVEVTPTPNYVYRPDVTITPAPARGMAPVTFEPTEVQ